MAKLSITQKKDFSEEYFNLAREQYKRKPKFAGIMQALGLQAQEIENEGFNLLALNQLFGAVEGLSRDALNRTALMFGLAFPEREDERFLILEIKASILVTFARCEIRDLVRLPDLLFGAGADVIETGDGAYLAVFSALSQKEALLLYKYSKRLIPAGLTLHGIISNPDLGFGFEGFKNPLGKETSGFMGAESSAEKNFAHLVIDEHGNYRPLYK